ncbi:hypothetical protein ACX0G7_26900, partial [Flavitalea antarctica]
PDVYRKKPAAVPGLIRARVDDETIYIIMQNENRILRRGKVLGIDLSCHLNQINRFLFEIMMLIWPSTQLM